MKQPKNELNTLVNRGVDRHLRLAITELNCNNKTAFITAMISQLLNIHAEARLPPLSTMREERLLSVKRIPQRSFGIPRSTYGEGLARLYGDSPAWPAPMRGVSEIRLASCSKSDDSLLHHFKDASMLYLETVDYPGEWLLNLPMLTQNCFSWSRQMTGLLNDQRGEWSTKWRVMCGGLGPLVPAGENRLADITTAWTDYLHHYKQQGLYFIQPGHFVLPGDMAEAPALQFSPWPDVDAWGESKLTQTDKHTNAGMLREWFDYCCEKVAKGFYKSHFLCFGRQIVLVDYLQPLNSGLQTFSDMCLTLTQPMQSSHYGQHTLFRRLFSPVIDKLLSTATKADRVTIDQHANMVSLLQQLIQDAWQNAAFEGISMDCLGLASIQTTTSGIADVNGEKIPALRGNRLSDGIPLTIYPDEVPVRLPGQTFWDKQSFQFETFHPQVMDAGEPLPHIRLDAALEFLIGDKLR